MPVEVESKRPVIDELGREVDELVVNIGPSHPSTHGVCRIIAHLDGEIVSRPSRSSATCIAASRRWPRTARTCRSSR